MGTGLGPDEIAVGDRIGSRSRAGRSWVVGGPRAVRAAAGSPVVTDVTVTDLDPSAELRLHRLTGAFLAGYRNANTRASYLQQLHRWFAWCTAHQLDPLAVERTHVELYLRWFERQVGSINTVCHGLSVLASFYRWLVQTGLADTTPIAAVRRPSRDETPRQTRLTRHELADWLNTAETSGGPVYAMACLLLLNGLRVSEVCGIDIDDLAEERWHHTVTIHGKGDKDATVPLAPRTRAAVEQAVDGREAGPLLRNRWQPHDPQQRRRRRRQPCSRGRHRPADDPTHAATRRDHRRAERRRAPA
jgi:integrase/recombinase XerD